MKIAELIKQTRKPVLYEPGNAVMWTDPYISQQTLKVHLNEQIDLGSRKPGTIQKTVDWILSHTNNENLNILDLGCGPGLYSEILAQKGHQVTGIDFSKNSVEYATREAKRKNLDIRYLNEDYTKLDLPECEFDLVMLIFADFGPLLPEERGKLLKQAKHVLKPGGLFIFDVLNDTHVEGKLSPKSWEAVEKGFWSEKPYLLLSESFLYGEEKLILYQHVVHEEEKTKIYRFWNHFFSDSDLENILAKSGFNDINFHHNVIPSGDGYDSEDVTFCVAKYSIE